MWWSPAPRSFASCWREPATGLMHNPGVRSLDLPLEGEVGERAPQETASRVGGRSCVGYPPPAAPRRPPPQGGRSRPSSLRLPSHLAGVVPHTAICCIPSIISNYPVG